MEESDHLGNSFSDEDSFDDPVPNCISGETGKGDEEEIEGVEDEMEDEEEEEDEEMQREMLEEGDFNLLTIEKVSMKVLTSHIGRVISDVMFRGEPGAVALFEVANKIVFQSTTLTENINTVVNFIIKGLSRIILDNREREESAENGERYLMLLVAKIAVKNKSMDSEDLLIQLIILIDRFYYHTDSFVRCRVCRLIAILVEEENRYLETMRELGDYEFLFTDDEPAEEVTMIPIKVKNRWMEKLAKSLFDKSPQCRSCALAALSLWDQNVVYKAPTPNCDKITIEDLIWRSLHDVDESVRLTASRSIHIINETDIDKCMNHVEMSRDNRVRQAIVTRLASDVHLFSFSDQQKFRFINLLSSSDSVRVRDVIHQRLVESWMKVVGEEIVSPKIFPDALPENNIPKQFPSIILDYLDPEIDAKAVYIFMKFATVRFIRSPSNSNELSRDADLEKFMKDLLKLNDSDSESIGLMRRTTWRLVEKDDWEENITELELKRTFARVFISRCLVDVLFELSKGRLDAVTLRDRALMFFTPDIPNFTQHLEEFCDAYFWNGQQISKCPEKCEEVILNNVFHLLNVSVKHGNDDTGKREYMSTLKKLLADSRLNFSSEIVVTMLSTILDLCKNKKEKEVECEWICETANKLLLTGNNGELLENEENLEILMKEGVVLDRMYLRSATMLIATCSHEDILTPSTAMSSLFKALIPALLGNLNDTIQKVGLELIGYASSIDFENCNPYLKLTRFLILRDDPLLKATGLRTLIKVIKSNGFPQTAEAIFYEGGENKNAQEYQESLAKLVEKTVILFQGEALGQAVLDCFSMLSVGDYAWPRLVSALLILVFSKNNEHLQLKKIFNIFCKKSVRSLWSKIHLLIGFYRAINVISSIPESEANCDLLEMTASICECVGRVQTVGEEENNQEGELHAEIELASRMIRRAVSRPSSWWIQHIFTSLATSLRLECVPMKDLERVHEELVDSYTEIRFNSGKLAQIAVKRFITHCEKTMILQARMNGLEIPYDLKKVKKEEKDGDGARASTSSISTGSKKRKRGRKCSEENQSVWDDDSFEDKYNGDDSFEYFPRSTRTRVRKDTPTSFVSDNVPEETNIADDSFEL